MVTADSAVEGPEVFVVRLHPASTGTVDLGLEVQTATILDNDPNGGAPTVSVGDASVWEGDTGLGRTVQVPLTLNSAPAGPTTVRVTVGDGTATSPADYKAFTKVVKFAAGAKQAYVTVRLTDDTAAEPDTTINVVLSSPTGGLSVGRSAGVITILDDDGA